MLKMFGYCVVAVVHFTDQNWIPKTVCCIRFVMICKIDFTNWNAEIALSREFMVVTYYIKFFQMGADRHNDILMSLLLLVGETIICFPIASFLNYLICYNRIFEIIEHDVGCYWFEFLHVFMKVSLILPWVFTYSITYTITMLSVNPLHVKFHKLEETNTWSYGLIMACVNVIKKLSSEKY